MAVLTLAIGAAVGQAASPQPPGPRTAQVVAEGAPSPSARFRPIDVAPAADPFSLTILLTGARLSVSGELQVHAEMVTVFVETTSGMTADSRMLGVSNPDGQIRLDATPAFTARFELGQAFVSQPLWVRVIAANSGGVPVASMRERVVQILGGEGSRSRQLH
ncbi:MAG TPA: hypothetical protein VGQ85_04995 [Candidatus Limnocylindrales bacterium]|nr:hypothetical protein [Candidatus Limnocylindrales bacterium]